MPPSWFGEVFERLYDDDDLDDRRGWEYQVDNDFARRFLVDLDKSSVVTVEPRSGSTFCVDCQKLMSSSSGSFTREFCDTAKGCDLCNLISSVVSSDRHSRKSVHITKNGSALVHADSGRRILHICSIQGSELHDQEIDDIQMVPNLFANRISPINGSLYFELLRQWLQDCDKDHHCYENASSRPTRLIHVGDSNTLRLVEQAGQVDYIALSHRWGNPTRAEKEKYCTTPRNFDQRLTGFSFDDLPRTFQDAIRVTRGLEKAYLWIDSICIIQDEEDKTDWKRQAELMEEVFAAAYCTLAATSASGWQEGFLEQTSLIRTIRFDDDSGRLIYVRDNVDNFEFDVNHGDLNRRGWVLQERVLSCRIIHFTEKHTYWECGEGVRCENFTRMNSSFREQYFLDPRFPDRLTRAGDHRTIEFVRYLFQRYAQCELSEPSDRTMAFSGLMKRMGRVFKTRAEYGVFAHYLPWLLLWRRSGENKTQSEFQGLPSWSWMRYSSINFLVNPTELCAPKHIPRYDTDGGLLAHFRSFKNCKLKRDEEGIPILIHQSRMIKRTRIVGEIWFDSNVDLGLEYSFVVITMEFGKIKKRDIAYWVLVAQRLSENRYTRVGLGKVDFRYVSKKSSEGRLL